MIIITNPGKWKSPLFKKKNELNKGKLCSVYGCYNSARCKGLCINHYVLKRYHEQHPKVAE